MEIPNNINFITENLTDSELKKVLDWYSLLRDEDRRNAELVIQYLHGKSLQSCQPGQCPEYALTNIIGSTARGEKEYNDIDFLWIVSGGGGWEPRELYDVNNQQEADFRRRFNYSIDREILNREYRGFLCGKMPDRSLITLTSKNIYEKPIHIVIQPGINLESQWDEVDREPRIVIDRVKNPSGGFFAAMERVVKGIFPIEESPYDD